MNIKKMSITTLLIVTSALFMGNVASFAQASQNSAPPNASGTGAPANNITDQDIEMLRSDLRAQRKQVTAQNMTLTADEATKFWPIFDRYRQEAIKANDQRWALIKEYAANYDHHDRCAGARLHPEIDGG